VGLLKIVKNSGAENAGVLIDALHFDRSDSTLDDIKALPAQYIHYAQLCDGPAQYDPSDAGLIEIARGARLLPGEGGIDLSGIIDGLPSKTVLSVEIPHLVRAETESPLERAIDALAASKKIGAQIR
jgi:sugar phosphate isomerase/epimerase